MILLTERLENGYSEGNDIITRGVFSTIETAKTIISQENNNREVEHIIDDEWRGRFVVKGGELGSYFDVIYDYQIVVIDNYTA